MAADDAAIDPDRFELIDHLGEGHHGVVHRVRDHARGEVVALKTLTRRGARDVYRFKREFRSLAALVHPNLVRLYELFSVGEEWMFTMELIDGVPLTAWVRPGGRDGAVDVDRLRDALRQLVDGLAALHAAGKLHRDLKPTNVLVEPSGRVVILDFGLIADVHRVDRTHEMMAVGTPSYMSPEQAADRPLTAASDAYAVGAMLYQALTGRRPFEGDATEVLRAKQLRPPLPPGSLQPGLPVDLETLCLALLERDPAARPSDDAILAALGTTRSPWTRRIAEHVAADDDGDAVDAHLEALHDALADSRHGAITVAIVGPARSGKSTLLRRFVDEVRAEQDDTVIFTSRADLRERLPLRVTDQIIDAVCTYLLGLTGPERAAVLPPGASSLAHLFPTARRVPGLDEPMVPGQDPSTEAMIARALEALRGILQRIAERHPVVVTIDDAQWVSDGGRRITGHFTGADAPRLLLVITHPTEIATESGVLSEATRWNELRWLRLATPRARRPSQES